MQETGLMDNSKQILNTKIEGDLYLIQGKLQEQKEKRDFMKGKLFNGFLYIILGWDKHYPLNSRTLAASLAISFQNHTFPRRLSKRKLCKHFCILLFFFQFSVVFV